jgi:ATP-dependent RNA helicase RhlE
MLDMGFMPAIQDILGHLPPERQTLLFSATFAKTLNAFVKQNFRNPVRVEVDTAVPAQTVQHSLYKVKQGMKLDVLTALLRKLIPASDSVLIFTRMRDTANQVAEHLHAAGMQVDVLHAEKTQRMRQDTMEQFRRGIVPYLVATDIAARGLDVSCISHVINYDMPASAEDYLHRIGRTGRMERAGEAISLVTRGDLRTLDAIERMLGKRISAESLTGLDLPDAEDATPAPRPMRPHADRPARNNDRPTRSWHEHVTRPRPATADADAPRAERPRQEHGARPHRATADAPRAERPWQKNGARPHHAPADADAPRAERPWQKKGTRPHHAPADAPRVERTKRGHADQTAPGRPAQGDRFHRRRVVDEIDTAPMRKPTMGKPARFAEASGRPERAPRRRDTDDTATPRRERPAGRRPEREASDASRPAQAPEKRFTGRASVAKHHKKFGATKRQKGAIGGAYRQDAPAATPSSRPARGKRPSNRG